MDTYIYELFNILPDIITRTIIICIILDIIQFVIFISFILWVRLTLQTWKKLYIICAATGLRTPGMRQKSEWKRKMHVPIPLAL